MPSRKFFANVRKALSLKPLSLRHQILRSYFRDTTLERGFHESRLTVRQPQPSSTEKLHILRASSIINSLGHSFPAR